MSLRLSRFVNSMLVTMVVFAGSSGALFGQATAPVAPAAPGAYKEVPPNPKWVALEKSILPVVGRILRGTMPFDEKGKAQLGVYYSELALPRMTTKDNWGRLPELREQIAKELRSTKDQQVFQYVIGTVYSKMRTFADPKENFHPAVRYNAVLLLGELNAVERGTRGADDRPAPYPDPLPAALDALMAEYQNPAQIDAVRVAALVGIDRHIKLDLTRSAERRIPNAKKQVILSEMLALLKDGPPAGRSAAGHAWMQRRAIDILAAMGAVGASAEASTALEKIVADNDAPISLRCTASEALAQWAPESKQKIDAATVSKNLGLIAVKACKDELDRIAALERDEKDMKQLRELIKKASPVTSGGFGAPGGSGESGMMQDYGSSGSGGAVPQEDMYAAPDSTDMYGGGDMYGFGANAGAIAKDPRIVWSQRRLKYQLTCVKRGLSGMSVAAKATPNEQTVARVAKALEEALAHTNPPEDKPDLEGLAASIRTGLSKLAFLSPEAAVISADPVTALDPSAAPIEAPVEAPVAPAAAPGAAAAEPAVVDPLTLDPAAAPLADPALPSSLE